MTLIVKMPTKNKIELPILKDIVVPGKEVTHVDSFPTLLNKSELETLQQQIEKIVQTQLETVLNKATKQVVKEITDYLDNRLPELIKKNDDPISENEEKN